MAHYHTIYRTIVAHYYTVTQAITHSACKDEFREKNDRI